MLTPLLLTVPCERTFRFGLDINTLASQGLLGLDRLSPDEARRTARELFAEVALGWRHPA